MKSDSRLSARGPGGRAVRSELDTRVRSISGGKWVVEADEAYLSGATHFYVRSWAHVKVCDSYDEAVRALAELLSKREKRGGASAPHPESET